jgi:hypothetical protein
MDGLLCLRVKERRRAAILRVGRLLGSGDRKERADARPLSVSRTDDIDDSSTGIGAILL